MTKTAKEIERDLIEHASGQLAVKARQYVHQGMDPAAAASRAIRDTKALFPPDWKLAVQGGGDEDDVEVWEVDDKHHGAITRVQRETEDEARMRLVHAVKERARADNDPRIRRIARWSNDRVLDILETAMPSGEHEAFRAVVATLPKKPSRTSAST